MCLKLKTKEPTCVFLWNLTVWENTVTTTALPPSTPLPVQQLPPPRALHRVSACVTVVLRGSAAPTLQMRRRTQRTRGSTPKYELLSWNRTQCFGFLHALCVRAPKPSRQTPGGGVACGEGWCRGTVAGRSQGRGELQRVLRSLDTVERGGSMAVSLLQTLGARRTSSHTTSCLLGHAEQCLPKAL